MSGRREAILAGASKVFSAQGFEGAAIADIARASKVSDGLIYRYFESKRALLIEVLGDFYGRVLADLKSRLAAERGFAAKFEALIRGHLTVFVEDAGLCRVFISEIRNASDYRGSSLHVLNRRYTTVFLELLREGVDSGDVAPGIDGRLLRDMVFGGIEHIMWRHLNAGTRPRIARCGREIAALLLPGIGPGRQ